MKYLISRDLFYKIKREIKREYPGGPPDTMGVNISQDDSFIFTKGLNSKKAKAYICIKDFDSPWHYFKKQWILKELEG